MKVEIPILKQDIEQDEEFVLVDRGELREKVKLHDYAKIYSVPGLYEKIVYDLLECKSPNKVAGLLEAELMKEGEEPNELSVLDVGAGNGIVGEELHKIGVNEIVGIDIIEEAREAVKRDRPDIYSEYHVVDLTDLESGVKEDLEEKHINCLITVAALGFGDIPPLAFANAINIINDGSWVALSIKQDFIADDDKTGFSSFVDELVNEDILQIRNQESYVHRKSLSGRDLHYEAIIAKKLQEIPSNVIKNI